MCKVSIYLQSNYKYWLQSGEVVQWTESIEGVRSPQSRQGLDGGIPLEPEEINSANSDGNAAHVSTRAGNTYLHSVLNPLNSARSWVLAVTWSQEFIKLGILTYSV